MRNLRNWKAFAFVFAALGLAAALLFAVAPPGLSSSEAGARRVSVLARSADDLMASFAVRARGEVIPYRVFGLFVMPGEAVLLEIVPDSGRRFRVEADGGLVQPAPPYGWSWAAPDSTGLYPVRVIDPSLADTILLNAFVMVPYDQEGEVNGYRIGRYERRGATAMLPEYAVPEGFIEVTPATQEIPVAPHFRLGQFVGKQAGGYPKYLVLRERLLLKLEYLLQAARGKGIPATSFKVLSGYRTPWYNRSIGNRTTFSRHVYGDAADIYVDEDGDGMMDDLNGDRRVNKEDVRVLARVVEDLHRETWFQRFAGGIGLYRTRRNHGPFLHVDTRGVETRWER